MNSRVMSQIRAAFNMQLLTNDIMELLGQRMPKHPADKAREEAAYRERKQEREMPLTLEEKATLDTLHGKQKKAYVKELKAKYEAV